MALQLEKTEPSIGWRMALHLFLWMFAFIWPSFFPCTWKSDAASLELAQNLEAYAGFFGLLAPVAAVWTWGFSDRDRFFGLACGEAHVFLFLLIYWLNIFPSATRFAVLLSTSALISTLFTPFFAMFLVKHSGAARRSALANRQG